MIGKELVISLDKKIEERMGKAKEERDKDRNWNHASEAGWVDECLRFLVARRLCPEKEETDSIERQRRMEDGKAQEIVMRQELLAAGHQIAKAERMENADHELTGEVDDLLIRNGDHYPLDYKSASTHMFRRIARCDHWKELLESKFYWVRHYPAQVSLYDVLYKHPCGILLFKDKDRNVKHGLDVPMDSTYTDHILAGLGEVNRYVAKKAFPPAEYKDICQHCGFCYSLCFEENQIPRSEVKVIEDPETELKLQRMDITEEHYKEYKKLIEEVKDTYKGENVIIGDHRISSISYEATAYSVPKDIKAQYKYQQARVRMTIKNLKRSL